MSVDNVSAVIENSVSKHGRFLVPVLQDVQEEYNYLPEEAIREVAEKLDMPLVDVFGVATFYRTFSLTPKGKHIVTVCMGTACHVRGGSRIVDVLCDELNIKPGGTTEDMNFTLETVNCLGCCAIGPVIVVDGEYYGEMTPQKTLSIVKKIANNG